jgi:hypothetical protein
VSESPLARSLPAPESEKPSAPQMTATQADPVPDRVWDAASRHYDDEALAQIVMYVALVTIPSCGARVR